MNNQIAQKDLTASERFMNKVVAEFGGSVGGEVALTNFQKRLAQNYFISLDAALKMAEEKRLKKKNNQDPLPVTWANVNMEKLARDVVSAARVGFDPAQKNHINMVPYKNNALNKYDIGFVEGYRGMELKAVKYGLDVPDHVAVEVVYSTDRFKSYKKDRNNQYEGYEFEITNEFDRGEIVGGFYYHLYSAAPEKNKLVTFSLKDIEKRKPQYASAEFWGGERDVWKDGKKVGKETVEGWYEKMVYKTIYRAAYGDITIDSQKIDDDYMRLKQMESSLAEAEASEEISQKANREAIDVEYEIVDEDDPDQSSDSQPEQQEINIDQQPPQSGGPGW
ncbi:recombinase RecT [Paenibacillus sp. EPM92]|uniref:recombinase RecT n=1 Tax=Paenibacillus sp. EPM92 TaxID=1561195 RepID=UPI001915CD82|nr:recombinase RecT [Paenibacillus sp. EPM92]